MIINKVDISIMAIKKSIDAPNTLYEIANKTPVVNSNIG